MQNITSKYLEAAIIDQVVAGHYSGRAYAFVAVIHEEKYALGVAVANEPGYAPVFGKVFDTDAEAKEWATGLNEHIGRDLRDVASVVASTMFGRPYADVRSASQ
jgi:hypothetical protein